MLAHAGRRLAGLFFGGSCLLCRGAARELLCAACDADLPRLGSGRCPRCALASPAGAVCGRCLARPPAFDATVAALEYRFPADVLVQALKFRSELSLAAFFGKLLTATAREPVDLVVPVPLFPRRLKERGFNQAMEIARHVARGAGTRLDPHACERVVDTRPQFDLPMDERERNVRGAFRCNGFLGGRVAVVDDVMTTGSTLNEIARTLKQAGAERVVNWVLARTPPPA
jgi:ComF family protein